MNNITSPAWWKAAAIRGLRTAITIAIPYFGAATLFGEVPWLSVASVAGLGFVLSLLTSLAGISEVDGTTVPVWLALLERVTKTVAQAFVAGIGTTVLFQDVNWSVIAQSALIAGLGSLLLAFLAKLPEAADPIVLPVIPGAVEPLPILSSTPAVVTPADPNQPAAGVPPAGV